MAAEAVMSCQKKTRKHKTWSCLFLGVGGSNDTRSRFWTIFPIKKLGSIAFVECCHGLEKNVFHKLFRFFVMSCERPTRSNSKQS